MPAPVRPVRFLAFHGTADPLVRYGGGPIGPLGRLSERRPGLAGRGVTAPIERVAADWAYPAPGRPPATPDIARSRRRRGLRRGAAELDGAARLGVCARRALPHHRRGPHLARGAQYLPSRIVGPTVQGLDATGVLLDFVTRSGGSVP